MTSNEIEIAIANHFGYRQNVIVPNVSWGLFNGQECDMVILRPSGWLIEIEIKCSRSDIKADAKKSHQHWNHWIRQTWFAVPARLACEEIDPKFGILAVRGSHVCTVRAAKLNPQAVKLSPEKTMKLYELAAMRIWSLKDTINRYCRTSRVK